MALQRSGARAWAARLVLPLLLQVSFLPTAAARSRIALLTASDAYAAGEHSVAGADNEEIIENLEYALAPEQWFNAETNKGYHGHATLTDLRILEKKRPGVSTLPSVLTGRVNAAYAARHGYDTYSGLFACPRWASWCTKVSALALLELKEPGGEETYDWVVVHDEDVFFTHGNRSIEDYLGTLEQARAHGDELTLQAVATDTKGSSYHRATSSLGGGGLDGVCLVMGKDYPGGRWPGINGGVLMVHNTPKARALLRRLWMHPLDHSESATYLTKFAHEQTVLNTLFGLGEAALEACVHVVPNGDLFGNHESEKHLVGSFMFHNTGGLCGRPRIPPRGGMVVGKKIDCLDELYGRDLVDLLRAVPDAAATSCGHFSHPIDVDGSGRGFTVNVTKHCLPAPPANKEEALPAIFLGDPHGSDAIPTSQAKRIARVPCLTASCDAVAERNEATRRWERSQAAPKPLAQPVVPAKVYAASTSGSPPANPPPLVSSSLANFRDLPSYDKNGSPLSRFAFVTLVTSFTCSQVGSVGYAIGALTLVESLRRTSTALRVVVALSDRVEDADTLASHIRALGAEPCLLEFVDHFGSGLSNMGKFHHMHHHKHHRNGEGHPASSTRRLASIDDGSESASARRRLALRWGGMFSKVLLWEPGGAFDRIVYLDADHLVLSNVDRVLDLCKDDLCGVNDMSQIAKTWDQAYVNAGFLVITPSKRDFSGLLDAIENNSLTTGVKGQGYHADAFVSRADGRDKGRGDPLLRHSFFTGGKSGSLLEQDLLNAYFWNRTTFLAPGFNSWANMIIKGLLVPGQYFQTQAEIDKYVFSRLYVLHGPLWQVTDGYKHTYDLSVRALWSKAWRRTAPRILQQQRQQLVRDAVLPQGPAATTPGRGAGSDGHCLVVATERCMRCDGVAGSNVDACWLGCTEACAGETWCSIPALDSAEKPPADFSLKKPPG